MTQVPLLAVLDLRVTVSSRTGTVQAVDGVSFSIAAGRTLALVGESGSGKSMTAMSLLALTPAGTEVETSGTALFGGKDLLKLSETELRKVRGRQIAVVFQDPSAALDPLMNVSNQIHEALPSDLQSGAQAAHRIRELLVEVGLDGVPHIERRYPHELSGGQQQRVAIAAALAGNPSLLIADEPTTALDMTVQAQILDLLTHLQQSRGMAMLLITHDLGVVAAHADDVLVLRKGAMIEAGPVARIIGNPEADYTRMLLDSRPRLDAAQTKASGADAANLLTIDSLAVSYPGHNIFAKRVTAVDGVSLSVPRGLSLGIVGESGSGKSTIAKAIVGLTAIDAGNITFEGRRLTDPRNMPASVRARLQYIFQYSYGALNPRLTVERAVGEPFAIAGMPQHKRRDAVVALLQEVGLSDMYLGRLPRELSGGQRQRVNIARALALSPELLICDEIVSALDVSIQAQVIKLLKQLQKSRNLTLLFISHDLGVVAEICDRAIVMRSGKIVEEGPVRTLFTHPSHPYTKGLLAAAEELEGATQDNSPIETVAKENVELMPQ